MDKKQITSKLENILADAGAGLLTTVDSADKPHTRWMTPIYSSRRPNCIYCFSIPNADKIEHIQNNPNVEWMIQSKDLREIVNVSGTISEIDNPAFKGELLEIIGPRLTMFFKANVASENFTALETQIHSATYFEPVKTVKETVDFL